MAAADDINALSGDLVVYLSTRWGSEYDFTLWNWSGVQAQGLLFEDDLTKPLP
jgi:hypothetical protein